MVWFPGDRVTLVGVGSAAPTVTDGDEPMLAAVAPEMDASCTVQAVAPVEEVTVALSLLVHDPPVVAP